MKYPKLEKDAIAFKISSCVDENSSSVVDKDIRIYTLTEDKENNFLMEYYIGTTEMNQAIFYRAMDTKGKNINIPKIIDYTEHNYWK